MVYICQLVLVFEENKAGITLDFNKNRSDVLVDP